MESQNYIGLLAMTYVVSSLGYGLYRTRHDLLVLYMGLARRFRPAMLIQVPLLIIGTLAAYTLLAQIPGLDIGWSTFVFGENASILFAPMLEGGPLVFAPFIALLVFAMPLIVAAEESIFRRGRETWARIAPASLAFGLIHLIAGIPLSAALAIALVGGPFMALKYLEGYRRAIQDDQTVEYAQAFGTLESAAWHLAYNYAVLAWVVVARMSAG